MSRLYSKLLKREPDIDPLKEVLVTVGAYEALFCSIMGNVNEGDEVIIIEPYFKSIFALSEFYFTFSV